MNGGIEGIKRLPYRSLDSYQGAVTAPIRKKFSALLSFPTFQRHKVKHHRKGLAETLLRKGNTEMRNLIKASPLKGPPRHVLETGLTKMELYESNQTGVNI